MATDGSPTSATHDMAMTTNLTSDRLEAARAARESADAELAAALSEAIIAKLSWPEPPLSLVVEVDSGMDDPGAIVTIEEVHFDDDLAVLPGVVQHVTRPTERFVARLIDATHDDELTALLTELLSLGSGVAASDGQSERYAFRCAGGVLEPVDLVDDALHRLRWAVISPSGRAA